jgi:hypothetical protein
LDGSGAPVQRYNGMINPAVAEQRVKAEFDDAGSDFIRPARA